MPAVVIRICIALLLVIHIASPVLADGKPLVSMNVINGEVRDILAALAGVGQANVVIDSSVGGTITIQLNNIPYDNALQLVCKIKDLAYHEVDGVAVIGTAERIGRGFGSVHIFKLKFIDPDSIRETILSVLFGEKKGEKRVEESSDNEDVTLTKNKGNGGSNTSTATAKFSEKSTALDRLTVDYATNSLILYGTMHEAEKIQKLLGEIDVPYQQISLEAEVVAVNKDKSKDLGIDWSWETTPQYAEHSPAKTEVVQDVDGNPVGLHVTEPPKVARKNSSGVIQFGRSPEGYPYEFYYQAKINALVTSGNAKVLAKPKVSTLNGRSAQILIGDRIPVLVEKIQNGETKTATEYVDAGIKLVYTPRINDNGLITVDVRTEVSSPVLVAEMKAYRITTRSAETTVRLKDGETMVIGGLIGSTDSQMRKEVPFLSRLPILGMLFKSISNSQTDTEVVIFLTPRIISL